MIDLLMAHPAAVLALVIGYVLLVVEMCIPGFGVAGIMGAALAVLGVFVLQPTALQALIIVVVYLTLVCIALFFALRSAAHGRIAKSRLVLNEDASKSGASDGDELSYFIGKVGLVHTTLRPVGVADFDGVRLNVVSDGDFIDRGVRVRVERVEGKRIIVAPIPE